MSKPVHCVIKRFYSVFSAPISSSHPLPACRGEVHDGGPHLPHPATPILPRHHPQHPDVGPPGTTQHPQTLEPELPTTCTPSAALRCPLLQRGERFLHFCVLSVFRYIFFHKRVSVLSSTCRILVKVPRVWRNSFLNASLRENSLRRNLLWGRVGLTYFFIFFSIKLSNTWTVLSAGSIYFDFKC